VYPHACLLSSERIRFLKVLVRRVTGQAPVTGQKRRSRKLPKQSVVALGRLTRLPDMSGNPTYQELAEWLASVTSLRQKSKSERKTGAHSFEP